MTPKKRAILILSLFILALAAPAMAKYVTLEFEFNFNNPPDYGYTLYCVDAHSGVIVLVKTGFQPGTEMSTKIPKDDHDKILCWVEVAGAGPTINKWRVYPKQFYQGGGFSVSADLPGKDKLGKCGDGDIAPLEGCDIKGNKGCDASSNKPQCCDCEYCGCADDGDCVQVSGMRQCGFGKCSDQERPVFKTICYPCGICINSYRCVYDPTCTKPEEPEQEKPKGLTFNIDSARASKGELMEVAATGSLAMGESVSVDTGGESYKIDVVDAVAGVNWTDVGAFARLVVNGEKTPALSPGDLHVLKDSSLLGIIDVAKDFEVRKTLVDFFVLSPETVFSAADEYYRGEDYEEFDYDAENLAALRRIYEKSLTAVETVSDLFGDENINIYIEGDKELSIVTQDGIITSMEWGVLENPTLNMYSDVETLELILEGDLDFIQALEDGRITYEGVGIGNTVKFWIVDTAQSVYSFFAGVFSDS